MNSFFALKFHFNRKLSLKMKRKFIKGVALSIIKHMKINNINSNLQCKTENREKLKIIRLARHFGKYLKDS